MNLHREPVAVINTAARLVETVLVFAVLFAPGWSDAHTAAAIGIIAASSEFLKTVYARSKVTPLNDPRTNEGYPLLPAVVKLDSEDLTCSM
jgi:hypothetical protein